MSAVRDRTLSDEFPVDESSGLLEIYVDEKDGEGWREASVDELASYPVQRPGVDVVAYSATHVYVLVVDQSESVTPRPWTFQALPRELRRFTLNNVS